MTGEGEGCFGPRAVGDHTGRFGADVSVAAAAGCAGSVAFPRNAFDCWPAVTRTAVVAPGCTGSGVLWTTVPSLVVTVAATPSGSSCTSTAKIVPRTVAVELGVCTSYRELPAMSFVTTCQVRPTACHIAMTVPPSGSVESLSTTSSVSASMSTVEPSK